MTININGIPMREAAQDPKSPVQAYALDASRTTRTYRFKPANSTLDNTEVARIDAVTALLGFSFVDEVDDIRCLRRVLPHAYPAVPTLVNPASIPYLFCTEVPKIEPYGKPLGKDGLGRAIYDWMVIEANYNTVPYFVREDDEVINTDPGQDLFDLPDDGFALASGFSNSRFISRVRDYAPKTITIRNGLPKFIDAVASNRAAIPEGLAFSQYRVRVTYTWHAIPVAAVPEIAMFKLANFVNDRKFDFAPPGTLVYISSKERPTQGPLGDAGRLVDLEHNFLFCPNVDSQTTLDEDDELVVTAKPMGLNAVPRVKDNQVRWHPINSDGDPAHTGDPNAADPDSPLDGHNNDFLIFKYGDLGRLFRPPQIDD